MKAYINSNTAELRGWLKGIGLLPVDYPECDRYNGLIAHITFGKVCHMREKMSLYFTETELSMTQTTMRRIITSVNQKKSLRRKCWN